MWVRRGQGHGQVIFPHSEQNRGKGRRDNGDCIRGHGWSQSGGIFALGQRSILASEETETLGRSGCQVEVPESVNQWLKVGQGYEIEVRPKTDPLVLNRRFIHFNPSEMDGKTIWIGSDADTKAGCW